MSSVSSYNPHYVFEKKLEQSSYYTHEDAAKNPTGFAKAVNEKFRLIQLNADYINTVHPSWKREFCRILRHKFEPVYCNFVHSLDLYYAMHLARKACKNEGIETEPGKYGNPRFRTEPCFYRQDSKHDVNHCNFVHNRQMRRSGTLPDGTPTWGLYTDSSAERSILHSFHNTTSQAARTSSSSSSAADNPFPTESAQARSSAFSSTAKALPAPRAYSGSLYSSAADNAFLTEGAQARSSASSSAAKALPAPRAYSGSLYSSAADNAFLTEGAQARSSASSSAAKALPAPRAYSRSLYSSAADNAFLTEGAQARSSASSSAAKALPAPRAYSGSLYSSAADNAFLTEGAQARFSASSSAAKALPAPRAYSRSLYSSAADNAFPTEGAQARFSASSSAAKALPAPRAYSRSLYSSAADNAFPTEGAYASPGFSSSTGESGYLRPDLLAQSTVDLLSLTTQWPNPYLALLLQTPAYASVSQQFTNVLLQQLQATSNGHRPDAQSNHSISSRANQGYDFTTARNPISAHQVHHVSRRRRGKKPPLK